MKDSFKVRPAQSHDQYMLIRDALILGNNFKFPYIRRPKNIPLSLRKSQ